jgi:hydrogenase-4 membrane subunit HyfE
MSSPTFAIWLISTILAAVVILMTYFGVTIPIISPIVSGHTYDTLLIAYALLWIGVVFRGF